MEATRRDDFSDIINSLPRFIPRPKAHIILNAVIGPIFSKRSFENLDSRGIGPARTRLGGRVVYSREAVIAWLQSESKTLA